jgi:hypothetical protein
MNIKSIQTFILRQLLILFQFIAYTITKLSLVFLLNFYTLLYKQFKEELLICKEYLLENFNKSFIVDLNFFFIFFVLFVKKSSKKLHFYINYYKLNTLIYTNLYPISCINKLLLKVS